jgi:hypothetical protein
MRECRKCRGLKLKKMGRLLVATAYRKHRLSPEAHRALALLGTNSQGLTEECFQQVSSFGDWLNHTH